MNCPILFTIIPFIYSNDRLFVASLSFKKKNNFGGVGRFIITLTSLLKIASSSSKFKSVPKRFILINYQLRQRQILTKRIFEDGALIRSFERQSARGYRTQLVRQFGKYYLIVSQSARGGTTCSDFCYMFIGCLEHLFVEEAVQASVFV